MNRLSFDVADKDGAVAITPAVDGIPLSALVTDFERANGYSDPAGGYGGIIPAFFSYGPLDSYFPGPRSQSCRRRSSRRNLPARL